MCVSVEIQVHNQQVNPPLSRREPSRGVLALEDSAGCTVMLLPEDITVNVGWHIAINLQKG